MKVIFKPSTKTSLCVSRTKQKNICKSHPAHILELVARYETSTSFRSFGSVAEVREVLLDKLENDLGIKSSEQWYQYNSSKLKENPDGSRLMRKYRNSVHTMLSELRPNVIWKPWMFPHVPNDYWSNYQNIKNYMEWISAELKINHLSDWYQYSGLNIVEKNGKGLINKFDGSLYLLLSSVYPSFDWKPWLFASPPRNLWTTMETKHKFAKHLEQELHLQTPSDWLQVTTEDFIQHGGSGLLKEYQGSIANYLQDIYPEKQWNDWEFKNKNLLTSFWTQENARNYFSWLAPKVGVTKPEDWNKLTAETLIQNGGKSLLNKHNGSLFNLLSWVFPEISWNRHNFMKGDTKRYMWEDPQQVLQFMESVKSELGVKEMTDWYKVTVRELRAVGGRGILARYGDSILNILKTIYPYYEWKPWMFRAVPRSFWTTEASVKEYVKWLETQLGISAMEDWYNISSKEVSLYYNGATILAKHGGLSGLLKFVYPEFPWDMQHFEQGTVFKPSKSQIRVFAAIQKIFPDQKVLMDVKHPQLPQQYELDIYLPDLKLALEYQGEHHYFDHYMFGSVATFQRRDRQKLRLCKLKGITLVYVPYWWDRTESSLRATIAQQRPDLNLLDPILHQGAVPIPSSKTTETNQPA